MSILYLLVPVALVLAGGMVWGFLWAVRTGQFDDIETPGLRLLLDDAVPDHATDAVNSSSDVQNRVGRRQNESATA